MYNVVLTTYCSLLTTYYSPFTTYYLLLATYYFRFTTYYCYCYYCSDVATTTHYCLPIILLRLLRLLPLLLQACARIVLGVVRVACAEKGVGRVLWGCSRRCKRWIVAKKECRKCKKQYRNHILRLQPHEKVLHWLCRYRPFCACLLRALVCPVCFPICQCSTWLQKAHIEVVLLMAEQAVPCRCSWNKKSMHLQLRHICPYS